MSDILLTITQAIQLVALAPSVFVVAFLLCSTKKDGSNIVPILYFLALSCSFIMPLLGVFSEEGESAAMKAFLLLGESMTLPFSYLLIIQFLHGRIPPLVHWGVLAIPLFGGSPFIYASVYLSEICVKESYCFHPDVVRRLYAVLVSLFVFLLVIVQFMRISPIAQDDAERRHKYWLIISLIALNLVLLGLQLMELNENLSEQDMMFTSTIIRIAFIYLVLTSIFRVFYEIYDVEALNAAQKRPTRDTAQDERVVQMIKGLMERDHLYREMGLSREGLATKLGLSEQQVSRIINRYFQKNFNELVNHYRIEEAKERLATENSQVTVIAFEVGFNSIASFNRVFKELIGSSPSDYRSFQKNRVL